MNESPIDVLSLSREALHELVWKKPILALAKEFGVSDKAIAKRCRKLGVPLPGSLHWGPRKFVTTLVKNQPLRIKRAQPSHRQPVSNSASDPVAARPDGRERTESSSKDEGPIDWQATCGPVKRAAKEKARPWAQEIIWKSGERRGPALQVDVSAQVIDRALRFCEALLSAARLRRWPFEKFVPQPGESDREYGRNGIPVREDPYGTLMVDGESIQFRLDERCRRIDHVMTADEKDRKARYGSDPYLRYDLVPTGEIRFRILSPYGRASGRLWQEGKSGSLVDQIDGILSGLQQEAAERKEFRERRRLEEIERQKLALIRRKEEERREVQARLIRQFEAQAGAWQRARLLRAYLRALKKAPNAAGLKATVDGEHFDFIPWAEKYVEQLDPLGTSARQPDMMDNRASPFHMDAQEERLKKLIGRLSGDDWQIAWKISPVGATTGDHDSEPEDT